MSWIKIQNGLVTNKKTARLAGQMKWKKLEAIGFMVSFWIWALENCEDGQLKDISDNEIAFAVGMDSAPGILEALKVSGFVDNKPLRIHDWPEYQHEFLRAKYRREPEKHQKIMDLYRRSTGTNTDRKTDRQIDSKKETTTAPEAESAKAGLDGSKPVNWEDCRTDLQRVVATFVRVGNPTLYAPGACTQTQATAIFKVQGKPASAILTQCGDCATACRAVELAGAYFQSKGLDWSLHAVSRNCADYLSDIIKEKNYAKK